MKLTNLYNVPETIVRATAIYRDEYDRGPVNRSVTQLINPPQIDQLRKRHFSELATDVSDEVWSLLGTAVHKILADGAEANMIVEERLYGSIDGWSLSGAIDIQEFLDDGTIHIHDYKTTSAYAAGLGAKGEWVKQLNIYRWLVEKSKGRPVSRLTIVAIIRDWSRRDAATDPNYPIAPVISINIPLWTMAEVEEYLHQRINIHREAELLADLGEPLPPCSDDERWERGGKWTVLKTGKVRPRVFETEEDAIAYANTLTDEHVIERRPGKAHRCEGNFCNVAKFCDQFRMKGGGQIVRDDDGREAEGQGDQLPVQG